MALSTSLIFSLVLILSACGSELRSSPYSTLHWLRSLDPATDCKFVGPGIPMADPEDCMNFYVCDGNGGYKGPFTCPGSMHCFNPSNHECTDDMTTCNPICTVNGPECKSECKAAFDHFFDPDDCSKHSVCFDDTGDNVFDAYCPSDHPYFNGKECVSDKAQCCICRAPTCETGDGGKLFTDPEDCHSYYVCVQFGSGLMQVHHTCEDGGSFVNGQCDPNTKECTNVCDLGGDVTSTTATPTTTTGCTDQSDFTCPPGNGFYARCTYCDPSYFNCNGSADAPTQGSCSGDLVFNPNPQFPYCIRPGNCPYTP